MPELYFRAFRTRGVYASWPAFRREINNEMQNYVFPDLVRLHNNVVAYWKVKPIFKGKVTIDQSGISVTTYAEGEAAKIWYSHIQGVEGRWIRPSRARRRLRIHARKQRLGRKYKRETKKIGRLRRPMALKFKGLRDGTIVYRKKVWWTGIQPKPYLVRVAGEYRETFYRRMENASRRGVRAAQREGS